MMIRRSTACALLLGTALSSTPALAQQARTTDENAIVVTGERPVTEASAGTKSATPIAETPQSISVVTAADIAGLGLQNLNQALRFVAGVTPEQRGSSAEVNDQFKLRGFDAPQYLDGLRLFGSSSGYANPQVDVSRLDRIEIVKGPASVLYGQSSPGGLVALSSKLPLDQDFYGAVAGSYGTYNLYRADADVGGRAGQDVLWRLYGSANGSDTQQRFAKRERQTVSGAVTIGASGSTSFTLLGAYSHDPHNGAYGVFPAVGTLIPNPNGRIGTSFDGGESGNRFQRDQGAVTYILRHDFGDGWAVRSSGRYQHVRSKLGLFYVSGPLDTTDASQRRYLRASYATRERLNNWTLDNQLTGRIETGPVTHDILIGVDRQVAHSTEVYAFGSAPSIDAYAPVYAGVATTLTPETVPGSLSPGYIGARQRQQGIYAQDQISAGGLRVTLSGRQDWARTATSFVANTVGTPEHSDKFTYRAGALYLTSFGLAPYVSWSTSFEPQTGQVLNDDGTTGTARPSLGKQLEAGAKYTVPGTQILVTASWFRIEQTNLLTSVPNSPFSIQTGKARSKGVEVEGTVPLPHDFNAKVAFSRQRVRTDGAGQLLGVGRGGISANLEWAPQRGAFDGFAVGGAVRHVDHVYAGIRPEDGIERNTPSYTLLDALARYDLGKLSARMENVSLGVNATNIFDKKYLTTCYTDYNWCWYGNRRTVQGTIGYRW